MTFRPCPPQPTPRRTVDQLFRACVACVFKIQNDYFFTCHFLISKKTRHRFYNSFFLNFHCFRQNRKKCTRSVCFHTQRTDFSVALLLKLNFLSYPFFLTRFQILLTILSNFFSPFFHNTCLLSVFYFYLDLEEKYLLQCRCRHYQIHVKFPINATLKKMNVVSFPVFATNHKNFTFSVFNFPIKIIRRSENS